MKNMNFSENAVLVQILIETQFCAIHEMQAFSSVIQKGRAKKF